MNEEIIMVQHPHDGRKWRHCEACWKFRCEVLYVALGPSKSITQVALDILEINAEALKAIRHG